MPERVRKAAKAKSSPALLRAKETDTRERESAKRYVCVRKTTTYVMYTLSIKSSRQTLHDVCGRLLQPGRRPMIEIGRETAAKHSKFVCWESTASGHDDTTTHCQKARIGFLPC